MKSLPFEQHSFLLKQPLRIRKFIQSYYNFKAITGLTAIKQ